MDKRTNKLKWYLGHKEDGSVLFRCAKTPTEATHGELYNSVLGPFRTKRGAVFALRYGRGNPHIRCVDDAERLAKQECNARTHYIAMAGVSGCMPQCCEAFSDGRLATAYLAEIHDLSTTQAIQLEQERFLQLDATKFGNDYCEITTCWCSNPAQHCKSGVYEEA
jgi:hypothetical protein